MVIICPTCHLSFKTSQGYQSHRRTQHILSTDPTGKSYKLTDFFKRVKSKPRCSPAPIEMKTISRVRSTSPELEPPSLPDAKSRPSRSMQSSLPKKSKAGGEVDISHFKISPSIVRENPDKSSPEFRVAHVDYYERLIEEKFPMVSKAQYARANGIKV